MKFLIFLLILKTSSKFTFFSKKKFFFSHGILYVDCNLDYINR